MMSRHVLYTRWLIVVCIGVILFSVMLVFIPQLSQPFFNLLIFQNVANPYAADANNYIAFVYVVLGAVMIGWMVSLLALIAIPFQRKEKWAWWAVTASVVIWYGVDTTMSVVLGFVPNAVLNTVFVAGFALPLGLSYKGFKHE
jgi:hypothetical protein